MVSPKIIGSILGVKFYSNVVASKYGVSLTKGRKFSILVRK